MTHWQHGMRAVCVDASYVGYPWDPHPSGLTEGRVYTIEDVFLDPYTGSVLLKLRELVYPVLAEDPCYSDGYDPLRFRPVDERQIDSLRALCRPKQKETADRDGELA